MSYDGSTPIKSIKVGKNAAVRLEGTDYTAFTGLFPSSDMADYLSSHSISMEAVDTIRVFTKTNRDIMFNTLRFL